MGISLLVCQTDCLIKAKEPRYITVISLQKQLKPFFCAKVESVVDSKVSWWFKKFNYGCKNVDNQAKLGRPKTVDSKTVPHTIGANLVSSTWRVSGELGNSHLHNLIQSIWSCWIVPHITKLLQNFWLT